MSARGSWYFRHRFQCVWQYPCPTAAVAAVNGAHGSGAVAPADLGRANVAVPAQAVAVHLAEPFAMHWLRAPVDATLLHAPLPSGPPLPPPAPAHPQAHLGRQQITGIDAIIATRQPPSPCAAGNVPRLRH